MKIHKCLHLFIIFCLLLSVSGCSKNQKVAERYVRIAIQPSAAFIPLYAVRYSGVLEKELASKKVQVIWQDFESGPPMNESLSADLSDIGVIGDVPTVLALSNSTRMKLVGVPARGPNAYAVLASKNNKLVNNFSDLKGKRVATTFGSTGHNFTKKLLGEEKLSFSDIEFLNINASSAENALSSGLADAVAIWEPNVTRMVDGGVAKIIAQGEATNLKGVNGFVVREEYLADNDDVIACILKNYDLAAKNIYSQSPQVISKIAQVLSLNETQVLNICKKYDYSCAITPEDIKALQDTVSFLVSINNLPREYRVEDLVDNSFFMDY